MNPDKIWSQQQVIKRELDELEETEKKFYYYEKYDDTDRVISSTEYVENLKNEVENEVKFYSLIPSLDRWTEGFEGGEMIIVSGPTKMGKCFGAGTEILMIDGSTKKIENICVGDKIMGVDSKERVAVSLGNGSEMMYKIELRNGDNFICNESHILTLRNTTNGKIVNIEIKDYLKKSKTFKHLYKIYKTKINFKSSRIKIDPYFLGLWLGDGTSSNVGITTADNEIVKFLYKYGIKLKMKITENLINGGKNKAKTYNIVNRGGRGNYLFSLQKLLRDENLLNNKHIPNNYKINSEKVRLDILAGLIDSDGYSAGKYSICFCNKNKNLIDDVAFLAKSLGFGVSKIWERKIKRKIYYVFSIGGQINRIPCLLRRKNPNQSGIKKKNILNYSFTVKPVGIGNYYGITINKDNLFVLSDFTVVHNTSFCRTLTENFESKGVRTLWFSYEEPMRQFVKKFKTLPVFYTPATMKDKKTEWIEQRTIEAIAKFKIQAVFIDNLHFLIDLEMSQNASLRIGKIIGDLKTIAIKYNIVVFLLAHIKKIAYDQKPSVSDIRDSSLIAQTSDSVLMINRLMENKTEFSNDADIYIQTHRRTGAMGKVAHLTYNDNQYKERYVENYENTNQTIPTDLPHLSERSIGDVGGDQGFGL